MERDDRPGVTRHLEGYWQDHGMPVAVAAADAEIALTFEQRILSLRAVACVQRTADHVFRIIVQGGSMGLFDLLPNPSARRLPTHRVPGSQAPGCNIAVNDPLGMEMGYLALIGYSIPIHIACYHHAAPCCQ